MKRIETQKAHLAGKVIMAVFISILSGCGGGGGGVWNQPPAAVAPTVTAVVPLANATGVPVNTKIITAAFSKAMAPATLTPASFTLACNGSAVTGGAVTYLAAGNVATLTLPATPDLPIVAACTARITTGAKDQTGIALASDYVWNFTTGAIADATKPKVTLTVPVTTIPGPTPGAPTNTAVTAAFDKDMAPATIVSPATSFTLTCPLCITPSPAGTVSYAVGSRTATFTPMPAGTLLEAGKTYTAMIKGTGTNPATDILGNPLAGNPALPLVANDYTWSFTTTAPAPSLPVSVVPLSVQPAAGALLVCPSSAVKASFNVPSGLRMDPVAVSAAFTVTGPGPLFTPVPAASVTLDVATGRIATFTPLNPLTNGVTYTATIKGGASGVKDLAIPANTMASDYTWNFTAGPATGICLPPPVLGRASTFGIAATAGVTNTGATTINGDVVLDPIAGAICNSVAIDAAGGFGLCGGSPPSINGLVISPLYPDAGITSGNVKADLRSAFLQITPPAGPPAAGSLGGATNLPAGTTLGDLAGNPPVLGDNYFTPGVYQSITSVLITGDLTFDALGNPDAVFVIQSSSTIGTADGAASPGVHTRILLIGGAKASNIFWQAGTSATLGTNSEFQGNILASESITMKTGASSCGRLLAGAFAAGAFVFDSNVVSVPGNVNAPLTCK